MIKYNDGAYGLKVLLRLHGSAVFKSLTPAVLSSVVYLICFHYTDLKAEADGGTPVFDHPYPMGALILAFSFLLTFKMSFSYNRVRSCRRSALRTNARVLCSLYLSYIRFVV